MKYSNRAMIQWGLPLLVILSLMLSACDGGGGGGGAASVDPPMVTALSGDVQVGGEAVTEDQQLTADATVTTAVDSMALLTYTDGSTVEIEPETKVTITQGEGASLKLEGGSIWVASVGTPMNVDASGAVASVAGAGGFTIENNADTVTVKAVGNKVKFSAGGSDVELENGQMSSASGGAPDAPVAFEPANALRISLEGEALVYLADPLGRAIGFHPTKEMVTDQIPGAWYSGMEARPQVISVPEPIPGDYTILLVAAGNQSQWKMDISAVGADLNYDDKPISKSSMITWGTPTGITLKLSEKDDGELSARAGNIWTLYDAPPGLVGFAEDLKRKDIVAGEAPPWAKLD